MRPENNSFKDYFKDWCEKNRLPSFSVFHAGTVWMLASAILIPVWAWKDIIPKIERSELDDNWGLKNAEIMSAKKGCNPTLFDIVRRTRNALAHGRVDFSGGSELDDDLGKYYCTFEDVNMNDLRDTFSMKVNLLDLSKFLGKL